MMLDRKDQAALDDFIKRSGALPKSGFAETATEAWAACCEHRDQVLMELLVKARVLDAITEVLSDERKQRVKSLLEDARQFAKHQAI
ncbi:hypothetical protein [Limnobacter alexandrii]|uniref:hypothetical protein n=1 Tax=Limnobacter alexandrii TaxID=2570352 RepID=UPI00110807E8|nr:hypothetical protein [Limnobacter alexandrii]